MENLSIIDVDKITVAKETPTDDLIALFRLANQMETICTKNGGIGLSASQIGVPWKFFVIYRNDSFEYYVNCNYEGIGDKFDCIEGCLSLKAGQQRFRVKRYKEIRLLGKQLKINDQGLVLEDIDRIEKGFYVVVYQHECDHDFGRERMIDVIGQEIEFS